MNWLFIIIGLIFLLFLLIVCTKLTINLDANHAKDDDHIVIKFRAWFGIIRYTLKIPMVKIDKESKSIVFKEKVKAGDQEQTDKEKKKRFTPASIIKAMKYTKELLKHVVGVHKITRQFLKHVSIKTFKWHTTLGIGDAASTGILAGVAWSLKGGILGLVSKNMKLEAEPDISITPSFQQPFSETKLVCMIQFRIGHAILAGIRYLKHWRGGRPNFKTRPLSRIPGNQGKKSV